MISLFSSDDSFMSESVGYPLVSFFVRPKEHQASSPCPRSERAGGMLGRLIPLVCALWLGGGPARAGETPVSELPALATIVDFHVALR